MYANPRKFSAEQHASMHDKLFHLVILCYLGEIDNDEFDDANADDHDDDDDENEDNENNAEVNENTQL